MWPFLSSLQSWQLDQPWRKTRQGCVQARRLLGTQRSFLPAMSVWGKPQLLFCWALMEHQAGCMAGTAGHRSPSLSCHSPGRTGKPGPPALPVLSTEPGKPQVLVVVAGKLQCAASWARCHWGYTLSGTDPAPREAQSPCKPQPHTNPQLSAQCSLSREWTALSHCGGLNKLVRNTRELRENCQSWNDKG